MKRGLNYVYIWKVQCIFHPILAIIVPIVCVDTTVSYSTPYFFYDIRNKLNRNGDMNFSIQVQIYTKITLVTTANMRYTTGLNNHFTCTCFAQLTACRYITWFIKGKHSLNVLLDFGNAVYMDKDIVIFMYVFVLVYNIIFFVAV